MCLVTWPLNESEAGVDIVLIEISLRFCFVLFFVFFLGGGDFNKKGSRFRSK